MAIYTPSGQRATTSIVNYCSGGGVSLAAVQIGGSKTVASGALTANTLATVLTINGAFRVDGLSAAAADTTSRTIRLQVIVDGVTVFDATSDAITTSSRGIGAAGVTGGSAQLGGPIYGNSSLTVKVASSNSETDKINLYYIAQTY